MLLRLYMLLAGWRCCVRIWSWHPLLWTLLTAFGRETPSVSPARGSGAISDLPQMCLLHISCSLLWLILQLVWLPSTPRLTRLSADSLPFVSQGGAKTQVGGLFLTRGFGSIICARSLTGLPKLTLTAIASAHRELVAVQECLGWGAWSAGGASRPVVGSVGKVFLVAHVQAFWWEFTRQLVVLGSFSCPWEFYVLLSSSSCPQYSWPTLWKGLERP